MAVYCAGKAYVLSFSEVIGEELRNSGVTVTALCPGPTQTGFGERANNQFLFRGRNVMSASEVASIGYRAMLRGKPLAIAGFSNRLTAWSVRFFPRRAVTKIAARVLKNR